MRNIHTGHDSDRYNKALNPEDHVLFVLPQVGEKFIEYKKSAKVGFINLKKSNYRIYLENGIHLFYEIDKLLRTFSKLLKSKLYFLTYPKMNKQNM